MCGFKYLSSGGGSHVCGIKPAASIPARREKLKVNNNTGDIGAEIVLDQVLMLADGEAITLGRAAH